MSSDITIINNEELYSSPSLLNLCLRFCVSHSQHLIFVPPSVKGKKACCKIRKDLFLPTSIWESLLENYERNSANYLILLKTINEKITGGLRSIDFNNYVKLKDADLCLVMKTCPYSLGIHNCPLLTKLTVEILNEFGGNLECLNVGNSSQIFPTEINSWIASKKDPADKPESGGGIQSLVGSIRQYFKKEDASMEDYYEWSLLRTPNLRKLIIWELQANHIQQVKVKYLKKWSKRESAEDGLVLMDFWAYLMEQFIDRLEYLDLSSCHNFTSFNFLKRGKDSLKVLHLHDVLMEFDAETLNVLETLSQIKYLDLSQYNELASIFANPDEILQKIVESLPNLVGLDISGTNLGGFLPEPSKIKCGINGLVSRVDKPLNFLGLLTSHYDASLRKNIPAITISGGGNIAQLQISLQRYLHRIRLCRKVIRTLHEMLFSPQDVSAGDFIPNISLLELLRQVLVIHIHDKHIQITTTATMFLLLKRIYAANNENDDERLGELRLNAIFDSVLRLINTYTNDTCLLRNSILIFMLLVPHLNLKKHSSYARKLADSLLTSAKSIFASQEIRESTVNFLSDTMGQLLCSLIDDRDEALAELQNENTLQLLLDHIQNLMSESQGITHTPSFLLILFQILEHCKDSRCCDLLSKTSNGVSLSIEFIRMCNNFRDGANSCDIPFEDLIKIQIPILALLTNLLSFHSSIEYKKTVYLQLDSNIKEFLLIIDHVTEDVSQIQNESQQLLIYLTCGLLLSIYAKENPNYSGKGVGQHVSIHRDEVLARAFHSMSMLDFSFSSELTFQNLTMLYGMLESHSAPEASFWALKTLVKLVEANPNEFGTMIAKDKTLRGKLDKLRRRKNSDLQTELQALCKSLDAKIKR